MFQVQLTNEENSMIFGKTQYTDQLAMLEDLRQDFSDIVSVRETDHGTLYQLSDVNVPGIVFVNVEETD